MAPFGPTEPARLSRLGALALLWGSNFLWIKIALRGLSPGMLVFVRLTLGALIMVAVLAAKGERLPRSPRVWGHLAVAAVSACVVPYLLFAYGERQVDSSIAGVLNATTPLWTVLIAMAVGLEQRSTPLKLAGIAVGFLGALVIFEPWRLGSQVMSWGGAACLLAAFAYAVSFVYMVRFLVPRGLSPLTLAAAQLLASSVLSGLALPLLGHQVLHPRTDALIAAVVLGLLGTGLAYLVNYELLAASGASATASVTYLLPIVAVALGALVLGESLSLHVVAGTAVVLAGVAATRIDPTSRRRVSHWSSPDRSLDRSRR